MTEEQEQPLEQQAEQPVQVAVDHEANIAAIRSALADGGVDEIDYGVELENPTEDVVAQTPPTTDTPAVGVATSPPAVTTERKLSPIWDKIKADYERDVPDQPFAIPEDVSPENEAEKLYEFLISNVNIMPNDVPSEVLEIIELHQKGKYNPQEYFKQLSAQNDILKLPSKDFLFHALRSENGKSDKNPEGWTDEDINEYLSKKSRIELDEDANRKKQTFEDRRKREEETRVAREKQLEAENLQKLQASIEESAQRAINLHKHSNDIFGIEFTAEEKSQFHKDYVEMLKLEPNGKSNKLGRMLSDEATLYKVAALLWKGEGLKGYITDIKESVKEGIERKLDPTLEQQRGSSKIPKPVDRGQLF